MTDVACRTLVSRTPTTWSWTARAQGVDPRPHQTIGCGRPESRHRHATGRHLTASSRTRPPSARLRCAFAKPCTQRRESLQQLRVRVAPTHDSMEMEKKHPKQLLRVPPHSLPNPSQIPPEALPKHCRSTLRPNSLRSPREVSCTETPKTGFKPRPTAAASWSASVA